jgi:hypothetical protein
LIFQWLDLLNQSELFNQDRDSNNRLKLTSKRCKKLWSTNLGFLSNWINWIPLTDWSYFIRDSIKRCPLSTMIFPPFLSSSLWKLFSPPSRHLLLGTRKSSRSCLKFWELEKLKEIQSKGKIEMGKLNKKFGFYGSGIIWNLEAVC